MPGVGARYTLGKTCKSVKQKKIIISLSVVSGLIFYIQIELFMLPVYKIVYKNTNTQVHMALPHSVVLL